MSFFEPEHDLFRRRAAENLNAAAACVYLVTRRQESLRGSFVFPGTDYWDDIEVGGQRVGHVDYGINPMLDRVYIDMLDIDPAHQLQGIGLGVLWCLWRKHQVPIVPLHQYNTSNGFWSLARHRFAAAGAVIEDQVRTDEERQLAKHRWQHLVPESTHDRSIRKYWEWVAAEHAAGRPAGPGIR
ncbi:hypothetical protein PL963_P100096 (plasmid) [Pseudomonas cerasi]|uniref:Uncharacterized protein n=1 Tax=Pseudomonas cerasi TaxID=1583341 RepID=A0A2K4W2G2_9PSED|nr:GNAT family N-acetyltransferase [Pseudomonas cerasi]SOS30079.1 hypothetical protein PL963_P100096 [Pseudomonas cerasi]